MSAVDVVSRTDAGVEGAPGSPGAAPGLGPRSSGSGPDRPWPACVAILVGVLAFGLLLTGLLAGAVGADRHRDDAERVAAAAARVAREVEHRMGAEVSNLQALRNEMMLDWPMDVASFHRRLDLHTAESLFASAAAVEFTRVVPDASVEAFVATRTADPSRAELGYPELDLRLDDADQHYLIDYVHPVEGNEAAYGLDLLLVPGRSEVSVAAGASGMPSITAPLDLVQGGRAVIVDVPVYDTEAIPSTVEARRQAFVGVAVVVIRIEDLLGPALEGEPDVLVTVTDISGSATGPATGAGPFPDRIVVADAASDGTIGAPVHEVEVAVADRVWAVRTVLAPGARASGTSPSAVWSIGTLVSLVVALAAATMERSRRRTRAAAQEVAEATREIQMILAAFPDMHFRVAADGTLLGFHQGGGGPARLTEADIGRPMTDLLPAHVLERADAARAAARTSSRPVSFEHLTEVDGRTRTLHVRFSRLEHDELAVSVRDITELADARRELSQLNAELEQRIVERTAELERTNAELEQFAYLASHDLQEPLRHVSMFVDRLQTRYGDVLDERGQQYLGFVTDGTTRMRAMIQALLEYSRVGRSALAIERVDLDDLVAEVLATMGTTIAESGARIECHTGLVVATDASLMRRVVQNLVSNAVRYGHPDRPPVVTITAARVGATWTCTVADNGIGIDDRFADRAFDMFERLGSTRTDSTGIGLAICRRCVELLGGVIDIERGTEIGTRITFTLQEPPS